MAVGQNPSVSIGRGPANPPPVPLYGDKWVKRIYSAGKFGPEGTAEFLQSSFGIPGPYFIDKVQVWNLNVTNQYGMSATLKQGLISDLGDNDIVGSDFGTANALASVTFKLPVGHAKQINNTGTGVLVSCGPVAPFTVTGTSSYACHLHVWVSI